MNIDELAGVKHNTEIDMTESFAALFEESIKGIEMRPGSIVTGQIVDIDNDWVIVNAGFKSEGIIPLEQFLNENGDITITVGDEVQVALEAFEDGFGETRLSRERAKRIETWKQLETACENGDVVKGLVATKVKGGYTVELDGVRAFLPGSLVDVRPVRDNSSLEGKVIELKVIKLDQKRNNVVVSRKAVLESENSAEREAILANMQEGQVVKGIVKNITDYGAFLDLGGVDGLLHITDISWKRIKHPGEVLQVGEEVDVKVLKFDRERNRVSLGMKQLADDPWVDIKNRYPERAKIKAVVTNLTDYGCFAEIEQGIEGLVHVSEMDWTNKNIHPSKLLQVGDEVDVIVLEIDQERRRISLGMKQCHPNPWEEFANAHQKGEKITGKIKSITDFGVFIGLDGEIDGLVHLSDISWEEDGEEAVRNYSKGDEIESVILGVDPERERISLGIKQLNADPFILYTETNDRGSIVKGTVATVDQKTAKINLADQVEGILDANEASRDKVEDLRNVLKEGDQIDVKITNLDKKSRVITLSIKAKERDEEKQALASLRQDKPVEVSNTIGDLLKGQIEANKESNE